MHLILPVCWEPLNPSQEVPVESAPVDHGSNLNMAASNVFSSFPGSPNPPPLPQACFAIKLPVLNHLSQALIWEGWTPAKNPGTRWHHRDALR